MQQTRQQTRIHQRTKDGGVKIITVDMGQYLYGHVPFSAPSKRRIKKMPTRKVVEVEPISSKFMVDQKVADLFGSATRIKTATTKSQIYYRDERNKTMRTISKGVLVKETVTYTDREGFTYSYETEKRVGAKVKCMYHDSHGMHGREPAYKNHRLNAIGKAGEMRAKYKRPTLPLLAIDLSTFI